MNKRPRLSQDIPFRLIVTKATRGTGRSDSLSVLFLVFSLSYTRTLTIMYMDMQLSGGHVSLLIYTGLQEDSSGDDLKGTHTHTFPLLLFSQIVCVCIRASHCFPLLLHRAVDMLSDFEKQVIDYLFCLFPLPFFIYLIFVFHTFPSHTNFFKLDQFLIFSSLLSLSFSESFFLSFYLSFFHAP